MTAAPARNGTRRRRKGLLRRVLLVGILALGCLVAWEAWRWPDVAALARERPRATAAIERWQALRREAGKSARPAWTWVPYSRISPHLKRAVLAGEDIGFFGHDGFDLHEIEAAARTAWERGELPRGASTLTQQLARNLWLSPSRSPLRKAREAVLTWQLERHLRKRRILELYLNVVEFGPGVFGAEAAARRYFGASAAALGEAQAAQLAGGLPSSTWHPGVRSRGYHRHVARIRSRMAKAGFLWKLI
jgi:monofunctional biosynthetic peptidoglycan transglycosylase